MFQFQITIIFHHNRIKREQYRNDAGDYEHYDDSEYVSAQNQKICRIITYPYRIPGSDEKIN